MSKPEDIPTEVWDVAQKAEQDCIDATMSVAVREGRAACETVIARAIMAAKAEEREACAQIAARHLVPSKRIAAAIRARGTP